MLDSWLWPEQNFSPSLCEMKGELIKSREVLRGGAAESMGVSFAKKSEFIKRQFLELFFVDF